MLCERVFWFDDIIQFTMFLKCVCDLHRLSIVERLLFCKMIDDGVHFNSIIMVESIGTSMSKEVLGIFKRLSKTNINLSLNSFLNKRNDSTIYNKL